MRSGRRRNQHRGPCDGRHGGAACATTWLPELQSALIDERDDARLRLEASLVSLKAAGRGSLVLRGLSVLCSFLEEVQLVFDPPFCYSGLAT